MGAFIVAANAVTVTVTAPSRIELPGDDDRTPLTRTLLIAIVLMGWPAAMAYAQTAAGPEGTYCLRGVHEVGSCLRLAADSTFEYFLA